MRELQKAMIEQNREKKLLEAAKAYAFEYMDSIKERRAFPSQKALEDLAVFDEKLPEKTGNAMEVVDMLHRYGSPATAASTGGRYFGFVNGSFIPVSMGAKWLADVWDQNSATPTSCPIASKLEEVCERWLAELLGLPMGTAAGFVSGSSIATLCGLAAGRNELLRRNGWDISEKGLSKSPTIKIVLGKEAHATVFKALSILGFGKRDIIELATDGQGRIIPGEMPGFDSLTLAILQAGNVNSGAFDPIRQICEKAQGTGAWIHVDGAFGLWAAASNERRHLTCGIELADSWSLDGHKTLNAPYDSGVIMCKDRSALASAMQASGSYLLSGENRNGMMHTPEMSRRARSVELWSILKYLGKSGVADLVDGLCDRALDFAEGLKAEGFEIHNDVVFNQVVTSGKTDDETDRILKCLESGGSVWCESSHWKGRKVIRISVCSWNTDEEDVRRSVEAFVSARGHQSC